MEILGKGLGGIVVSDSPNAVRKFYISADSGRSEEESLSYLSDLQEAGDFDINCAIPRLLEIVGAGQWKIDGEVYTYCNRMERIPGISARQSLPNFTKQTVKRLGEDLGATAFAMHHPSPIGTHQKLGADAW